MIAYLAPRDGFLAGAAFVLLIAGAAVGLTVKWITEALSQLAVQQSRLDDLRRRLGGSIDTLPTMAAALFEEIANRIRRQDTEGLDASFDQLTSNIRELSTFSAALDNVTREMDKLEVLKWRLFETDDDVGLDADFIDDIVQEERFRIDRLRLEEWPWERPDVLSDLGGLESHARTISRAMGDVFRDPESASGAIRALECFRSGEFEEASEMYERWVRSPKRLEPREGVKPDEAPARRRSSRPPFFGGGGIDPVSPRGPLSRFGTGFREGRLFRWMTEHPRWLAGAASVLVVAAVGLQLQYLDRSDFDGGLGDWLGLVVWAAVIELSGVSVLDVLGRLGGGRSGPAPAPAREVPP